MRKNDVVGAALDNAARASGQEHLIRRRRRQRLQSLSQVFLQPPREVRLFDGWKVEETVKLGGGEKADDDHLRFFPNHNQKKNTSALPRPLLQLPLLG